MAKNEAHKITVEIVDNSVDRKPDEPSPAIGTGGDGGANASDSDSDSAIARYNAGKAAAIIMAVETVVGYVNHAADYSYSKYISLTEDYITDVAVNNAKKTIAIAQHVSESTSKGIQAGSSFGPVGMVIGGIIGLAVGAADTARDAKEALVEQSRRMNEESYALYFNTSRAGLINNSRGTEN